MSAVVISLQQTDGILASRPFLFRCATDTFSVTISRIGSDILSHSAMDENQTFLQTFDDVCFRADFLLQ
jgi:hypothetical protein